MASNLARLGATALLRLLQNEVPDALRPVCRCVRSNCCSEFARYTQVALDRVWLQSSMLLKPRLESGQFIRRVRRFGKHTLLSKEDLEAMGASVIRTSLTGPMTPSSPIAQVALIASHDGGAQLSNGNAGLPRPSHQPDSRTHIGADGTCSVSSLHEPVHECVQVRTTGA